MKSSDSTNTVESLAHAPANPKNTVANDKDPVVPCMNIVIIYGPLEKKTIAIAFIWTMAHISSVNIVS